MTSIETANNLHTQLDEITRLYRNLLNCNCEEAFLRYLSLQETLLSHWMVTENECRQRKGKLDSTTKDILVLENKLRLARQLIDDERFQRESITRERDSFRQQLKVVRGILLNNYHTELSESVKKNLVSLESSTISDYVDAESGNYREDNNSIDESQGMVLTLLPKIVASRPINVDDNDDGLALPMESTPAKYSSFVKDSNKQANSGICARSIVWEAEYNSTVTRDLCPLKHTNANRHYDFVSQSKFTCPLVATSSRVAAPNLVKLNRRHNFVHKTFIMPETCARCCRKIAFKSVVLKCADCAVVIHPECQDMLAPCKLHFNSPQARKMGSLSDYVQHSSPPFVPAVVIDCVKEIERRGLQEARLYRMLGTKPLVFRLLEGMRCRKETELNFFNYDTHSICRALITFFESLEEPLIPPTNWKRFTKSMTKLDAENCDLTLAISMLPRVNRDTLAFIVLHLQNVLLESDSSADDLVEVFVNVIFGRKSTELENASAIARELILLPGAYWTRFAPASFSQFTSSPSENRVLYSSPVTMSESNRRKRFFDADPPI